MNALELAECIESDPDGNGDLSVSLMLRKQDAAIKQLREALERTRKALTSRLDDEFVVQALAATEEFAK